MSGHSKWATIKRKKAAEDAKRGKVFTRLVREIMLAAREGGGDPDTNVRLRLAIDKARNANMPSENIERAVKRGTGEGYEGIEFEEVCYEGYAPFGVALMIECVTDNRNRSVAEIRHVLNRYGGNLGEGGSVAWQFSRQAYFAFPANDRNLDQIFDLAVESGAEEVKLDDPELIEIFAPLEYFKTMSDQLERVGIIPDEAGLRMIPKQELELEPEETLKIMRLIEALEELDDVQNIYSNLYISDEMISQVEMA
ncbi:MAG: YebC/PmpR family DNA-binding transcriptional regulator [Chloroflexota bacterium]